MSVSEGQIGRSRFRGQHRRGTALRVNLRATKRRSFAEIAGCCARAQHRNHEIVAEDALTPTRAERGQLCRLHSRALSFGSSNRACDAGLTDVSVTSTHLVTEGMHSAIIRATKPA